jgi:hypothetical protein
VWCVAIEVVEIAFQIQAEADLLGDEVAGEGGLPALIQDGLLDPLDTPIRLRPASPDEGMPGLELGDGGLEAGRANS